MGKLVTVLRGHNNLDEVGVVEVSQPNVPYISLVKGARSWISGLELQNSNFRGGYLYDPLADFNHILYCKSILTPLILTVEGDDFSYGDN